MTESRQQRNRAITPFDDMAFAERAEIARMSWISLCGPCVLNVVFSKAEALRYRDWGANRLKKLASFHFGRSVRFAMRTARARTTSTYLSAADRSIG